MINTIGVLGCGWLGKPLAESLLKEGYHIKGTTTDPDKLTALQAAGINPFLIAIGDYGIKGGISSFLKDLDVLIINIPPGLRKAPTGNFVARMQFLNQAINDAEVPKLIFVSSTSVYGALQGEVWEDTVPKPISESGKQLLAVEKLFSNNPSFKTTIIRFGGLIGPKRHPVRQLSGKKNIKSGEELLNLIHLDDCIRIITTILRESYWNQIFNGVYPYHPSKKEYYTNEALKMGVTPPEFQDTNAPVYKKIVKSQVFNVKSHPLLTTIVS